MVVALSIVRAIELRLHKYGEICILISPITYYILHITFNTLHINMQALNLYYVAVVIILQ